MNIIEKAAQIEQLALEIMVELEAIEMSGGKESNHAALIVMDAMALQGKQSPKHKSAKKPTSELLQNNPHLWNPKIAK